MTEDKVADRLKNAVQKLRLVVEVISEQALNRAILINDMSKDLENLTTSIETKEAELRGFGRSVAPFANRLIINKNTLSHKVTYTSGLAVERISVQAFVVKPTDL